METRLAISLSDCQGEAWNTHADLANNARVSLNVVGAVRKGNYALCDASKWSKSESGEWRNLDGKTPTGRQLLSWSQALMRLYTFAKLAHGNLDFTPGEAMEDFHMSQENPFVKMAIESASHPKPDVRGRHSEFDLRDANAIGPAIIKFIEGIPEHSLFVLCTMFGTIEFGGHIEWTGGWEKKVQAIIRDAVESRSVTFVYIQPSDAFFDRYFDRKDALANRLLSTRSNMKSEIEGFKERLTEVDGSISVQEVDTFLFQPGEILIFTAHQDNQDSLTSDFFFGFDQADGRRQLMSLSDKAKNFAYGELRRIFKTIASDLPSVAIERVETFLEIKIEETP